MDIKEIECIGLSINGGSICIFTGQQDDYNPVLELTFVKDDKKVSVFVLATTIARAIMEHEFFTCKVTDAKSGKEYTLEGIVKAGLVI